MKKKYGFYGLLGLAIFILDRATKAYALAHWHNEYTVNPFLFFQVTINRGISWGLLNYNNQALFVAVTALISVITVALIGEIYWRIKQGKPILGELCIIAGSLSNIADRITHSGVIDFIVVHKGGLTWPVFNVADCFIVLGVALMFFRLVGGHE